MALRFLTGRLIETIQYAYADFEAMSVGAVTDPGDFEATHEAGTTFGTAIFIEIGP